MVPVKKLETEEEKKKKQEEAQEQLDAILNQTRPKNLGEGLGSGVGNIVGGAIGGIGVAVLAPIVGFAQGSQKGVISGILGGVGGAVAGVVGGATVVFAGAVSGTSQIVRGVMATPASMMEPRKGKWWDEQDGKWVMTDLVGEKEKLSHIPADDKDLLGDAMNDAKKVNLRESINDGNVVDMKYYDSLDLPSTAEPSKVKRQYYVLARKYHPDKNPGDKEAADKFKDVAEAYQVLSHVDLRKKYDKEGMDGLSADKTEAAGVGNVDPALLFAFLFGSDKFNDYIGRLAMATAAATEDSPKVSFKDARTLQKRRCTRLAIILAAKLQPWVEEDYDAAKLMWQTELEELSAASYGVELLQVIGQVYCLSAVQFLGSLDSGIGLPGISKWAKGQSSQMKQKTTKTKGQINNFKAVMKITDIQKKAGQAMQEAKTDDERKKVEEHLEKDMSSAMLAAVWTTTTVDISNTIHETCQMVLHDHSVKSDAKKRRGRGLKALGEIFMKATKPAEVEGVEAKDAKKMYEEAAFAAMLETIAKKEQATHRASFVSPSKDVFQ